MNPLAVIGLGISAIGLYLAFESRNKKPDPGITVTLPPGADLWTPEEIQNWIDVQSRPHSMIRR